MAWKTKHTHRVLESWIPTPQSTFDALRGPDGLQAPEISFIWHYDGIHFSSLASEECFLRFSYHANPQEDF